MTDTPDAASEFAEWMRQRFGPSALEREFARIADQPTPPDDDDDDLLARMRTFNSENY